MNDADPARLRVRLDLAYDGTDFSGWAAQPGRRTVQGTLEDALATILRAGPGTVRTVVAGRTDAGVHARGQVVHVDVDADAWAALPGRSDRAPAAAALTRLGGVLPEDVVVHAAGEAPAGFDARFSAVARRYTYRLADRLAARVPARRHDVAWHRRAVDEEVMAGAAEHLLGEHDFLSFCRPRAGATTIRTLRALEVARTADGEIRFDVAADAFCHHMVRSLVGALLAVGEGRRGREHPAELLARPSREQAAPLAPPRGLTLEQVLYPEDAALAARARATRQRRDGVEPQRLGRVASAGRGTPPGPGRDASHAVDEV